MKIVIIHPGCSKPAYSYLFCWTQKKILWRMWVTKQLLVLSNFYSREKIGDQKLFGYPHSPKYLLLCSTEDRNYYRFGTTCGCVNDAKKTKTIPLSQRVHHKQMLLCKLRSSLAKTSKTCHLYSFEWGKMQRLIWPLNRRKPRLLNERANR